MAELLYEGKAKKVFATADPNEVVIYYKDDATALNGAKHGTIVDKGIMNNTITTFFFDLLAKNGIPHHIIKKLSDREQLCKKVKIIPVEVVCRNIAAGSLAKKMGVEEGYVLHRPLVEFYYKSDELDDPMISPDYGVAFGIATDEQIATIREMALKINAVLKDFLATRKVRLIDFKTEYGVDKDGNIILADEITPDCARLWDKDRFRRDMGGVEEAYHEIIRRLTGEGK